MVGAILVFHDVTEVRAVAAKMTYVANYDNLTGLPNRVLLIDRIDQAIKTAHRQKTKCSVISIDIDGFGLINDTLGYFAGDSLLIEMADYLHEFLRENDTVCRSNADEFSILLMSVEDERDVTDFCNRLLASVNRIWEFANASAILSISAGVAIYPSDGEDAKVLIARAESALHEAKRHGPNSVRYFCYETEQHLSE